MHNARKKGPADLRPFCLYENETSEYILYLGTRSMLVKGGGKFLLLRVKFIGNIILINLKKLLLLFFSCSEYKLRHGLCNRQTFDIDCIGHHQIYT